MMLIEETPIPDAALPVEAFKAHLRLGSGFGQDDVQTPVLQSFLRAAIAAIEARTGKALIERAFALSVDDWREPDAHRLPVAPVVAVTEVALIARDGSETPVDADRYWLERDAMAPRLRASGSALPRIASQGTARVRFDAGYAPAFESVPVDLQQAVMLLAAHYYEYRNDTALSEGCMPFGVSSLIERFKHIRLGAAQ